MVTPPHPYVAICGPIAAGKTTLTKALSESFGWWPILENLDAHPFLTDYYGDMRRWGFHTVATFLIRALTLQETIREKLQEAAVCQDWYFAEHYDTYGVVTYEEGILDERERRTCEELHRYLMTHMRRPDLVVVLTADAQTLRRRTLERRRASERGIPLAYMEHLVSRYAAWEATLDIRHIVVDTVAADFAQDASARGAVLDQVRHALET